MLVSVAARLVSRFRLSEALRFVIHNEEQSSPTRTDVGAEVRCENVCLRQQAGKPTVFFIVSASLWLPASHKPRVSVSLRRGFHVHILWK